MSLPDIGNLSYGDARFDALYKSSLKGSPEWDAAGRTIKYMRWLLTVEGVVTVWANPDANHPAPALITGNPGNATTTDPSMQKLRWWLTEPAARLTYTAKGFGPLTVNGPGAIVGGGTIKDVNWGPKPKLLTFTPLGSSRSALVTWEVEFCIPECQDATFFKQVLAYNYESNLSFDEDFFMTWTVKSTIEIAMTRPIAGQGAGGNLGTVASNRLMPDDIENYRLYLVPTIPDGMRPVRRTFDINAAKNTITSEFVCEEIPAGGLPANCTTAHGSYTVANKGEKNTVLWTSTLRATYVVRRDKPRREAWFRFLAIFRDRAARSSGSAIGTLLPGLILLSFTVEEGLYLDSRRTSFSASWLFPVRLRLIIGQSGLWRAVPDSKYFVWESCMQDIMGDKTWWGAKTLPKNDIIVDACMGSDTNNSLFLNRPTLKGNVPLQGNPASPQSQPVPFGQIAGTFDEDNEGSPDDNIRVTTAGEIDPAQSWLAYEFDVDVDLDTGTALHKPLPQALPPKPVDSMGVYDWQDPNGAANTDDVNLTSNWKSSDIIQQMATPTYRVRFSGRALRVAYPVPTPEITSFAGVKPVADKQRVSLPKVVANYGGTPVYLGRWDIVYHIPVPPKQHQIGAPNFMQGMTADAEADQQGVQAPVSVPQNGGPGTDDTGNLLNGIIGPVDLGQTLPTGIVGPG